MKDDGDEDSNVVKETANLNMYYELDVGSKNYDSNAVEHRVN